MAHFTMYVFDKLMDLFGKWMSAYDMVEGLFLSAWYIQPQQLSPVFPYNSHEFLFIPIESFHLEYLQNFATLDGSAEGY